MGMVMVMMIMSTIMKKRFISKYVFSMDHKMIAKQFLITGIIWAIIGAFFSVLFRLQLGYPDATFPWLESILGHWAKGGRITAEAYYALVTMHGTILVFFVLTAGLSGTFSNLLIPLQVGARDMASPFMNMLSYWFFFLASVMMMSFPVRTNRSCFRRLDSLSSAECTGRRFYRF